MAMEGLSRTQYMALGAGMRQIDEVQKIFANTTGNGAVGTVALFTAPVDGVYAILAECTSDLTSGGAATIKVGTSVDDDGLVPSVTATDWDAGERLDKTGLISGTARPSVTPFFPVKAGASIFLTVGTAALTGGAAKFILLFNDFSEASRTNDSGDLLVEMHNKLDPVNDAVTIFGGGWYFTTITTAATTVVASFPVYVAQIKYVTAGTPGNLTAYNAASATGTPIIPAYTPAVGANVIDTPSAPVTCDTGLTVVTAGTNPVVTVTWRPQ